MTTNIVLFYEKYLATDVAAGARDEEEWRGYVVWICDEKNKQDFPMKQGILSFARVHLLLNKGYSCCSEDELEKKSTNLFRNALYVVVVYFDHTLYTSGTDNIVYLELEGRSSC